MNVITTCVCVGMGAVALITAYLFVREPDNSREVALTLLVIMAVLMWINRIGGRKE